MPLYQKCFTTDLTIEYDYGIFYFQFEDMHPKNLANLDEFEKNIQV